MSDKPAKAQQAQHWRGDIPIHHQYTIGLAGQRFFSAMRDEKKLLASRCSKCGQAFLPPKIYCELCFEETSKWVPVLGPGHVKSFTMLHLSLDEEPLDEPTMVAFIEWDEIRGGLIHRLADIETSAVRTGMAVEPVWADERAGSINDILYFRPVAR